VAEELAGETTGRASGERARRAVPSWLVPDPPRQLPGHRWLKIGLRAAHVLTTGILVGGVVFAGAAALRGAWFHAALLTGLALVALDSFESCAFWLQVRGVVVLGKLVLLGALPWLPAGQAPALAALVVVSVLSSHAPARMRYFLLVGRGRVTASDSRG
jgi:hypothetical protein